jgi:hypothetical protein
LSPFSAVSKVPTVNYETTIRLIGQIVGRADRFNESTSKSHGDLNARNVPITHCANMV